MLDLKTVEGCAKKIYEDSFEVSILQEDLERKLDEIYENAMEFKKGRLSKGSFKSNEAALKKSSLEIMKSIKELIKSNIALLETIRKNVRDSETKKQAKKVSK